MMISLLFLGITIQKKRGALQHLFRLIKNPQYYFLTVIFLVKSTNKGVAIINEE